MNKAQYRSLVNGMFNDLNLQLKYKIVQESGLDEIKNFEEYTTQKQDILISFLIRKKLIRTRKEL